MISRYGDFKSILQEMQSEVNIVDLLLSPEGNSEVDCLYSDVCKRLICKRGRKRGMKRNTLSRASNQIVLDR